MERHPEPTRRKSVGEDKAVSLFTDAKLLVRSLEREREIAYFLGRAWPAEREEELQEARRERAYHAQVAHDHMRAGRREMSHG